MINKLNLVICSCLHLNGVDGRRLSVRIFKTWTADWEDFCRQRNCYVASWSWVVCGISPPLLYWQIPFITTLPSMPTHISRVNSFSSPPLASLDHEYYSTLQWTKCFGCCYVIMIIFCGTDELAAQDVLHFSLREERIKLKIWSCCNCKMI